MFVMLAQRGSPSFSLCLHSILREMDFQPPKRLSPNTLSRRIWKTDCWKRPGETRVEIPLTHPVLGNLNSLPWISVGAQFFVNGIPQHTFKTHQNNRGRTSFFRHVSFWVARKIGCSPYQALTRSATIGWRVHTPGLHSAPCEAFGWSRPQPCQPRAKDGMVGMVLLNMKDLQFFVPFLGWLSDPFRG